VGEAVPESYYNYKEGGGFKASSKDEDGNVWVQCADVNTGSMWGMMVQAPKDANGKDVSLKDFCISFSTRYPDGNYTTDGDGGIALLASSLYGRYDLAVHNNVAAGGEDSQVSLWHAMDVDGGPFATTLHNTDWGERGSRVGSISLYSELVYNFTVCGRYQTPDQDGNEFMTLYVFLGDKLIIEQKDIAYWEGNFGLRGYISPWEYGDFKVTDFPLVCPDGIDHYNDSGLNDPTINETRLPTPEVTINGTTASWAAIDGASGYEVYNGDTKLARIHETSYSLAGLTGDGSLKVRALSSGFPIKNSEFGQATYAMPRALNKPVLTLNEKILSWAAIDHATGYKVYHDGTEIASIGSDVLTYDISTYTKGTLGVKAIGDGSFYLDSEIGTYDLIETLPAPKIVYDGTNLTWAAVEGATKYEVYFKDAKIADTTDLLYKVTSTEIGKYQVKAIGDGGIKTYDSALSNSWAYREIASYASHNFKGLAVGAASTLPWGDPDVYTIAAQETDHSWATGPDATKEWAGVFFPAKVQDSAGNWNNLSEYAYTVTFRLPTAADDGNNVFQILYSTGTVRYAAEIVMSGATSSLNIYAANHIGDAFNADLGGKLTSLDLKDDVAYKFTVFVRNLGDGNCRMTCFIDNVCAIDIPSTAMLTGDFGLACRNATPAQFTDIAVTDIPLIGPDGVDRY
jgi:hypothetical protein